MRSSEKLQTGFLDDFSTTATLSLPLSGGGRLGWGGLHIYGIKGKNHPLHNPLPPDGRGGEFSWAKPTLRLLSLKSTQKIPLWVFSNFRHCPTVWRGLCPRILLFFLDISLCFFSVGRNSRFISRRHSRAGGNPDSERPLQFLKISIASKT